MELKIKQLVEKYNQGKISAQEEVQLEEYIVQGQVKIEELAGLNKTNQMFGKLPVPEASESMTSSFYQQLSQAKEKSKLASPNIFGWIQSLWSAQPAYQWAYTLVILALGVTAGYFIEPPDGDSEIRELSAEVTAMKEMMMLSLLEKESTSDRLKAVNLTSELPDASGKVTQALLKTLNQDENVNVRLATIEALYPYASDPKVRQGLIRSIGKQDSPLVQVALAELMVALQEKNSVKALEGILDQENTPEEVKDRIKESIRVLI